MNSTSAHNARPDVNDGIVTPEAVVLELETAGFASRVLAALIDLAVLVGIYLVALILSRSPSAGPTTRRRSRSPSC